MEYKILEVRLINTGPASYRCIVAIDAGNRAMKAYDAVLQDLPDKGEILRVARTGRKLSSEETQQLFPEASKTFRYFE